jgi:flagellar biosynthesis/type III secretory pathway protein FliH
MIYVLIPLHEAKAEKAARAISEMRLDLEAYAKKPESKETYIDKINQRISVLMDSLEASQELIEALMIERLEAHKKGFAEGFQRGLQEGKIDPYTDKEGFRMQTIIQAQKQMPNLF